MNKLFYTLCGLQILDIMTTTYGLKLGLQEGNGFMSQIVDNFWLFVTIKIIAVFIIGILMVRVSNTSKEASNYTLGFLCLLMGIVVSSNFIQIYISQSY